MIGRFLSVDPVTFIQTGNPSSFNRYAYVSNNPIKFIDPNGQYQFDPSSNNMVQTQGEILAMAHAEIGQPVIDFFTEDAIDSVHAIARGDVKGAVVGLGLAIFKPAKMVDKAIDTTEKVLPDKALKTLREVRENGKAPPGQNGGKFKNREGRLPEDGSYREYDVDPKPPKGTPRNGDRLVVDQDTGRAYFTDDHYETFTEIVD